MNAIQRIEAALMSALATHKTAHLALPGGRSAIVLMEQLTQSALPWSSIVVSLVDERAVDAEDPASNAKLVRENLLRSKAQVARFVPLFDGISAESSVERLNKEIPSLDVVVLGMGEDGHFASLFPSKHPVAGLADDRLGFVATEVIGSPALPRISMTRAQILSASLVLLLVSSEEKRQKVQAALQGEDPMNPVSYLFSSSRPIHVVWPDGEIMTTTSGVPQ